MDLSQMDDDIRRSLLHKKERERLAQTAELREACYVMTRIAKVRGLLVQPDLCEDCGVSCKVESHHENYYKPFEVIWLCRACHVKRHPFTGTKSTPEQFADNKAKGVLLRMVRSLNPNQQAELVASLEKDVADGS